MVEINKSFPIESVLLSKTQCLSSMAALMLKTEGIKMAESTISGLVTRKMITSVRRQPQELVVQSQDGKHSVKMDVQKVDAVLLIGSLTKILKLLASVFPDNRNYIVCNTDLEFKMYTELIDSIVIRENTIAIGSSKLASKIVKIIKDDLLGKDICYRHLTQYLAKQMAKTILKSQTQDKKFENGITFVGESEKLLLSEVNISIAQRKKGIKLLANEWQLRRVELLKLVTERFDLILNEQQEEDETETL